jgi:hypothetical protein
MVVLRGRSSCWCLYGVVFCFPLTCYPYVPYVCVSLGVEYVLWIISVCVYRIGARCVSFQNYKFPRTQWVLIWKSYLFSVCVVLTYILHYYNASCRCVFIHYDKSGSFVCFFCPFGVRAVSYFHYDKSGRLYLLRRERLRSSLLDSYVLSIYIQITLQCRVIGEEVHSVYLRFWMSFLLKELSEFLVLFSLLSHVDAS